jgi:PKD repeat protein
MKAGRATSRNSSLALRVICAAIVVLGGVLPTAFIVTPARAGIFNPIPVNAQLEPTDSFSADEALFAYFTADITGGDICIVNVDVDPVAGVDCQSGVAWGTPNHFVGLGSMFEGIEAPFLAIGTWRLLAAPTPTKAFPFPVPQVSIPFTVVPCGPTCDKTIGKAAIDAWKAAASQATQGGVVVCTLLEVQAAAKGVTSLGRQSVALRTALYDAIRNPKKVIRAAVADAIVEPVLDFAGGVIGIPVPDYKSPEEMAIELLQQLVCSEKLMYQTIAEDPPDTNFTTVAQPRFAIVPDPLSQQGFDLAVSADRQRGLGEAMLHAFERYSGAVAAGQPRFVHLQAGAIWQFGSQLVREMRASANGLRGYGQRLAADPNLPQPAVADQAELNVIVAVRQRVQSSGFLPQELAQLSSLGFTADEVSQIRAEFERDVSQAAVGVSIDLPISALAADLDQAAVAFDAIAREALSVSAQTNSPPVASFITSATTGPAPLTVTFTSTSADPDGDALTASWDFGDGATGSGALVQHTYAAVATYTATLTVSDGRLSHSTSTPITATSGPPATSHFDLAAPASAITGSAISFEVTAKDAANSTATGYAGTVHFSSTDLLATLPASYTFTPADAGVHTFLVTFHSSGTQSVTAADTATGGISGTRSLIVVDQAPQLAVIKHVINDSGGTRVAADFTLTVAATTPSLASFPGSETGTVITVGPGTYSVDELSAGGYAKSLSAGCSGTIAAGQSVTCTITNDDILAIPIDHLVLSPLTATVAPDAIQTYVVRARDALDNDLGDVTAGTTFTIAPDGICLANSCSAPVLGAHTVTATHTASGTTATATVTVSAAHLRLTVAINGSGTGTVTSTPLGIACNPACQADFDAATSVTLNATADPHAIFIGWAGDVTPTAQNCVTGKPCVLTMDRVRTVYANFIHKDTITLTIQRRGAGGGTISFQPPALDCLLSCSREFSPTDSVDLTATPNPLSTFTGWSGEGCSGTGICHVTMGVPRTVIATYGVRPVSPSRSQAEVNAAVVRGVHYIDAQQNADGSFGLSFPPAETATAILAYGVLDRGDITNLDPDEQSHLRLAISWLLTQQDQTTGSWKGLETYFTGLALTALGAAEGIDPAIPAAIQNGRRWLLSHQQAPPSITGNPLSAECSSADDSPTAYFCGGWNYETDPGRSDESNTGFAITGLGVTGGVPADAAQVNAGWQRHIQELASNPFASRNDGGGDYQPGGAFASNANNTGSLIFGYGYDGLPATDSGVRAAITFGEDILNEYELVKDTSRSAINHVGMDEDGICPFMAGCDWERFVDGGFHYSLWALTKGLGHYMPANLSDGSNWYAKVADLLLLDQGADGSWPVNGRDDGSVIFSTGLAIDALGLVGTPHALTVTTEGSGTGTVSSTPAGIACGPACTHDFADGTFVTLKAAADAGSTFIGWAGSGCSGTADCTIKMNVSRTVTATFASGLAHLTLVKMVINNNGGTAAPTAWTLSATGPTTVSGSAGSAAVTNAPVSAGTYILSESGGPSGYSAGSWSCVGATLTGSSLVLVGADSASCTITNDDQAAQLTVIKHVINDSGGTKAAGDFTLTVTGSAPSPASFPGSETGTLITLNPGSYSVDELTVVGYTKTSAASCTGTIAAGETKICTIINDDEGTPPGNRPPFAVDDTLFVPISAASAQVRVLTNDSDPDGDVLRILSWTNGAKGDVSCTTLAGDCTYFPHPGFAGSDLFSYTIVDDKGGSASANVLVKANHAPLAVADLASTAMGQAVTFNVLANDTDADGDPLTLTSAPTSSVLGAPVQCQPTGDCTYTPSSRFQGWDGFNYYVNDGHEVTGGIVCVAVGNADGVAGEGFAVTRFATFPITCIQGQFGPIGVAFDATGRLYVGLYSEGLIYRFGPSGGVASPATQLNTVPLVGITALAFTADGRLYADRANGQVLELNPDTGAVLRTVAEGLSPLPHGLAVDPFSGDLFVASDGVLGITDFASHPGTVTRFADVGVDGLTFGPDGTLWGAGGGPVFRIEGTNAAHPGAVTRVADVPSSDGIAVGTTDGTHADFLAVNRNDGVITEVALGTEPPVLSSILTGGSRGDFIAVGPDGCLYATQSQTILKITRADGSCPFAPTGVVPRIALAPPSQTGLLGTSRTVIATLHNVASPAGASVTFAVTGANPQTATRLADSSGMATFSYAGTVLGMDTVVARATIGTSTVTSNDATVTWTMGLHFSVVAPPSVTAASPFSFSVAARDDAENTVAGYVGTVQFASSDPLAALPANYTFTPADVGVHTFTATLNTAGTQSITAADTAISAITGTASVLVSPSPAAHLTVIKHVINNNGGTAAAGDWTVTVNGTAISPITFPGNEAGSTVLLNAGSYSVTESGGPAGYAAALSGDCAGTIASSESRTCTITNDDKTAHLKLMKAVINDNGGTAVAIDFNLAAAGPTPISGNGGVESDVNAGTYTLSETGPVGYSTTGYDCGASVTLALGQSKTCTITNDDIQPRLIVVKHVINDNGGATTASAFAMNVTGSSPGPASFPGAELPGTTVILGAGNYSVGESSVFGYTQTSAVGCSGTIAVGETKTCTITNDDQPGTIIVQKITKPLNTGSFGFTTTGTGYNTFTLTGGGQNSQTLNAGTYTVNEGTQLGWILTGIGGSTDPNTPYNCTVSGSGGSTGVGDLNTQTATINLKNGDTVTCVFENIGQGVTRTQGFWATHTPLASIAWFGGTAFGHTFPGVAGVTGIGDTMLCGRNIDTLGKLMGGFWSDIPKTSTGAKRSALDQARMQLLQQMLAAELNASVFGTVPSGGSGQFAAWEAASCGTNQNAIKTALQQAASFNTAGDSAQFTPGMSADSKNARAIANKSFWDILP